MGDESKKLLVSSSLILIALLLASNLFTPIIALSVEPSFPTLSLSLEPPPPSLEPWRLMANWSEEALRELTGFGPILARIRGTPEALSSVERLGALGPITTVEGGLQEATVVLELKGLKALLSLPGISSISIKPKPLPTDQRRALNPLGLEPQATSFRLVEVLGAVKVQEELGVSGEGIRVAVVDTGVDFSHPDLREALDYFEDGDVREPLVLDADQSQVLLLSPVKANSTGYLPTNGSIVSLLTPGELRFQVNQDYFVGNITTASGTYRFGMTRLFFPLEVELNLNVSVGVLLTDPQVAGDYTLAYVDLNNNFNFTDDEPIAYYGDRLAALDEDGDGFPDFSLGLLGGFFFDALSWFSYPPMVLPGWDRSGRYLSIFYDFFGHGTSVAGTIASKGGETFEIEPFGKVGLPGVAQRVKIIAIKALWLGNVDFGMLWAAGFDVIKGRLVYTGQPRAQIINNSWELPNPLYDFFGTGWDLYSMLVNGISLPGFLAPNYPGVLVVQAAGNGGYGYGTVTSPSAATLALAVGDSTSTHSFANLTSYSPIGNYDDALATSPRGPTPIGEVKPDLLAPGDIAATITAINMGGWSWFGGSSIATALSSGTAALVLEALGGKADPQLVKRILKLSAKDLGYSPFVQGSGRLDALSAVRFARLLSGGEANGPFRLLIESLVSSSTIEPIIERAWMLQWGFRWRLLYASFWGIDAPFPFRAPGLAGLPTANLYLGREEQGGRVPFALKIENPSNEKVEVREVKALRYLPLDRFRLKGSLDPKDPILEFTIEPKSLEGSELTVITLAFPFDHLDPGATYIPAMVAVLRVFEWRDENGDGEAQLNEMRLLNRSELGGTGQEVTLGRPSERFQGKLIVQVEGLPVALPLFTRVPIQITVTSYRRSPDPSIVFEKTSFSLGPKESLILRGRLNIPPQISPGPREGYLRFLLENGEEQLLPYSYLVVGRPTGELTPEPADGLPLYDASTLKGGFNWGWRYISGDWRIFPVAIEDPSVMALEVEARWSDSRSVVDIITLGPDGQYAGVLTGTGIGFGYLYLGLGRFLWHQTAEEGPEGRRMVTFPSALYIIGQVGFRPQQGDLAIYTILVHQVLHGGSRISEPLSLSVRTHASKLMPNRGFLRPGESMVVDANLRLPYKIKRSSDSPFFNDFSLRLVTLATFPLRAAPFVWSLDREFEANETISTRPLGIRLYAPSYSPQEDELMAIAFIAAIPELKLYWKPPNGEVEEFIFSPLYIFQDWTIVRVGFVPPTDGEGGIPY